VTFLRYFAVWEARRRPLKVGIHKDIEARIGRVMTPAELANTLR
jgi:hypothetical protein